MSMVRYYDWTATTDMLALPSSVFSTIRSFSAADQNRRRRPSAIT